MCGFQRARSPLAVCEAAPRCSRSGRAHCAFDSHRSVVAGSQGAASNVSFSVPPCLRTKHSSTPSRAERAAATGSIIRRPTFGLLRSIARDTSLRWCRACFAPAELRRLRRPRGERCRLASLAIERATSAVRALDCAQPNAGRAASCACFFLSYFFIFARSVCAPLHRPCPNPPAYTGRPRTPRDTPSPRENSPAASPPHTASTA